MNISKTLSALVVASLFSFPAQALVLTDSTVFDTPASIVDDFDDLNALDLVGDRDGYSLSSPVQAGEYPEVNPGSPTMLLINFLFSPDIIPFSFHFDSIVNQAGAYWETDLGNVLTLQAYLGGNLIEEATITGDSCCDTPTFLGFTGIEFDTLTMSSVTGTGNVYVDRVSFTTGAIGTDRISVAEPASLALLGLGLLGMMGFTHRRR